MHEHEGSICKYAVFWIIAKFAERKKTQRAETGWPNRRKINKGGALGVDSPWALA